MIYVRPRKMMNIDRMIRQREKHHPLRYHAWWFNRDDILDLGPDGWAWLQADLLETFRMEVARWNMWSSYPLSEINMFVDYAIDFHQDKVVFEVRRLPKRDWRKVMAQQIKEGVLTPHEVRACFGLEPM